MRSFILTVPAVFLALQSGALAAHPFNEWSAQNSRAKASLQRIIDLHPRFRADLGAIAEADSGLLREWVEFLEERGDRNTNDFEKKKGADARPVRQLHDNHGEVVRSFREWIRDNKEAALALVKIKDGLSIMCKGGGVPEEKTAERSSKSESRDKEARAKSESTARPGDGMPGRGANPPGKGQAKGRDKGDD